MEEIRIPRGQAVLIIGLLGGISAIFLGVYFYSLADGPSITSPLGVKMIAGFIGLSGLGAVALVIREFIRPSFLVISDKGIDSQLSFGFVPWDEVVSFDIYEQVEGTGKYSVNVKGLLIEVKDPDKILEKVRGLKKFGPNRSYRLRGSPVFVPDHNWSWSQDEIHKILQTYLTEYRKTFKSGAQG